MIIKKRSPLKIALKVLLGLLALLLVLIVAVVVLGIARRGLHQEEYLAFPMPDIPVELPRDFAAHDDYKTEWWYYTGHLTAEDGHSYGFELTFFRIRTANMWYNHVPVWWIMYPHGMAAHMAISDNGTYKHMSADMLQFNSSDDVGAKSDVYDVWMKDWYARAEGESHKLFANDGNIGIDLTVTPLKPPALHGKNGYHWKGRDGIASNYISFTRMQTEGTITVEGKQVPVTGTTWMDHEFTSFRPSKQMQGWDWFAIQLDNNREVMLYQMRRTDGAISQDCTGSIIEPDGTVLPIAMPAYKIVATDQMKSPQTGAVYPMGWNVALPDVPAELYVRPTFPGQEMVMTNSDIEYWEGACTVEGTWAGEPITGRAYVELTGYLRPASDRF